MKYYKIVCCILTVADTLKAKKLIKKSFFIIYSELKEECGLSTKKLNKIGILEFEFENDSTILEVHVFETFKYFGELIESEEMRPKWYNLKDIPFKQMWPDDEYWFPYMLKGQLFKGYFLYRGQDLILKHNIQPMEELPLEHDP